MEVRVKDSDGNILTDENAVKERWSEYFEQLLNVDDGRVAEISGAQMNGVLEDDLIDVDVTVEDVRKAVKKMKKEKSQGVDGLTSEMCFGGNCMSNWLTRVFTVCVLEEKVPSDFGERNNCTAV